MHHSHGEKKHGKSQGSEHGKQKEKARGPSSESQALHIRSLDEIMGIEALNFGVGIGEVLTPRSEIFDTFNEWLQYIHKS